MAGESVRGICGDEDMPSAASVFKWLNQFPDFAEQYARAKEVCCELLAEECLDIADDGSNDWMERFNERNGTSETVLNGEHVQRSKLRLDARKWYLSKVAPKKYGDHQSVDLNANVAVSNLTDEEILAELAILKPAIPKPSDDGSDLL